jgi:hypothetical protein
MQQKGHFLLMEREEFRDWLEKQSVSRSIKILQVHHTASPNYTTRRGQDHFVCLEGMRNFHVNTNGWDATGQNITTFEDGMIAISLDRDLSKTPAGIGNANTGAICIENIGSFDIGGDSMTAEQKKTIVHLYACLANRFNIPVTTSNIVYHHWYSADGTKIVDFATGTQISSKLPSKTCPGTNFWGDGNTVAAANRNFIPQIREELYKIKNNIKDDEEMTAAEKVQFDALQKKVQDQASVISDLTAKIEKLVGLSVQDTPSWAKEAITALKNKNAISETDGSSYDFYRTMTILKRLGLF